MPQLSVSLSKYPARASLAWYVSLIAIGSLLLTRCSAPSGEERPLSVLDATFTAASAACVTGLAVRSTEHDFSLAGQVVILALIQLGGIGIMTVTTFFMFRLGARQDLRSRALIAETLGADERTDLNWILAHVIRFTLLFEFLGFLALLARNLFDLPLGTAAWQALFHSVSAFCNAGFSLYDDSLVRYQGDLTVNAVIGTLVILGGIGFPVILDIRRHRRKPWGHIWGDLTLHSKLMLLGTVGLLALGTLAFLALEWKGVLRDMSLPRRLQVALFHSVTCRTAGFNTVDIGALTNAMLLISVLLMAIGAGPCSTAGGFKVSTVMVLVAQAWSTLRGMTRLNLFRRTIPARTIERATVTTMLFGVIAVLALTVLLVVEESGSTHRTTAPGAFLDTLFEVVSALGTVGLSTGVTSHLTATGKWVLIGLMLLGRLGPISVFVALSLSQARDSVEFASEEPLIG